MELTMAGLITNCSVFLFFNYVMTKLFIYGLFNDAFSSSDYIASNDTMIN
jgi:hypothetical protein